MRSQRELWFLAWAVVVLVGCTRSEAPPPVDPDHLEQVKRWREDRLQRLTAPTGWLTLVGLDWLRPGDNPVGSDTTGNVVLPKRLPGRVGVIRYAGGEGSVTLTFVPEPGADLDIDGTTVDGPVGLESDAEGAPTTLHRDGVRFYVIERNGRYGVRVKDERAEVRRTFRGIDSFAVDSTWRIEARIETYDPPRRVAIPNVLGESFDETVVGAAIFERDGVTHRLDLQGEPGDEEVFVVFGDQTNRNETYGAGRFLVASLDAESGTVVLDFNRAYNPPCAFTPYATCPLPPKQNVLAVPIRAGEKRYGDPH